VHNEGGTKGILVTTADYGPDAYEFVKGKPLTLLNGSNLLYLLAKHGRTARIDLHEARKLLQGQPRQPNPGQASRREANVGSTACGLTTFDFLARPGYATHR
jgi:Restriction endonuclease